MRDTWPKNFACPKKFELIIVKHCHCHFTDISLNARTPHIEAIIPGAVVIMGKLTVGDKCRLATNHAASAIAQTIPDIKPGMIADG